MKKDILFTTGWMIVLVGPWMVLLFNTGDKEKIKDFLYLLAAFLGVICTGIDISLIGMNWGRTENVRKYTKRVMSAISLVLWSIMGYCGILQQVFRIIADAL